MLLYPGLKSTALLCSSSLGRKSHESLGYHNTLDEYKYKITNL